MELSDLLAALRTETAALAAVLAEHPTAPVVTCPGWDVAELAGHTGQAHRWALANITAGDPEHPVRTSRAEPPADVAERRAWLLEGAEDLARTVAADPDAEVWTLGGPGRAAFWARRQAHETAMHRYDGETARAAAGGPPPAPIDAELAVDGIDEAFRLIGFMLGRGRDAPGGTCHLHRTDGPGEWMLRAADGRLEVTHEHGKGDAAVRGGASDLLLYLWGRRSVDDLETFGDRDVAAAWGSLTP
jgi:uncharacterized protein (TIGR03083 family)